jgi:hypothetical protein
LPLSLVLAALRDAFHGIEPLVYCHAKLVCESRRSHLGRLPA